MIWKPFFVLFCTFLSLPLSADTARTERKLYLGKDSSEAVYTFKFEMRLNQREAPTSKKINEQLENQLSHLFGPWGEASIKAVPRGNHVISKLSKPELLEGTNDTWVVHYEYKGTIVVSNKAKTTLEAVLPYNPEQIYEQAKVGSKKPCTDSHYDSEGDFWYFWNPDQFGCKLKEGEHYARVAGSIKRIKNTSTSYPEYNRLVRTEDGKKQILISILMGMDEESKSHNPLKSTDINADNFRESRNSLLKMGFEEGKSWSHSELETYFKQKLQADVYVEELTKETSKGTLVARMFFGPSGISETSDAFHYVMRDALENQGVMIYDGHSGLGGHLDLDSIEEAENFKIKMDKKNYQMYYFNSCSSYTYYNTMYFERKKGSGDSKGTKNLDILTNGLATLFSVMHDTNMAVVKAIDLWATGKGTASYQTLAKQIDSGNLFGINGDEDNPNTPPR